MSYKATKKWRQKYPKKWAAMKNRYYNQFEDKASNKNQHWTVEDIKSLEKNDISDRFLAKNLHRSVRAIQCKRHKLKERIQC